VCFTSLDLNKICFEELDDSYEFNYREDKMEISNCLGYDYISEAIIKEYFKLKSEKRVAGIFNLTEPAIRYQLKKWNIKRNKRGRRKC
jgi:hypothetical protein